MESDQEEDFRAGWDEEGADSEGAEEGQDNNNVDDDEEFLLQGNAALAEGMPGGSGRKADAFCRLGLCFCCCKIASG